jgi:hypothetical protein
VICELVVQLRSGRNRQNRARAGISNSGVSQWREFEGTSPTVREGSQSGENQPSLTVGLMPRLMNRLRSRQNHSTTGFPRELTITPETFIIAFRKSPFKCDLH